MKRLLTFAVALASLTVFAQPEKKSVVIGSLTEKPNALLIVNPENADQGVLLPQLSTDQRMSLKPASPSEDGLIVFDKNLNAYYYWSENKWAELEVVKPRTPGFLTIDPVSFQPLVRNDEVRHSGAVVFESDNTFVTVSNRALGERVIAPVSLPHGSTMEELVIYYMDSDNQGNLRVTLMRKEFARDNEPVLTWESNGAAPVVRDHSSNNFNGMETIDLEKYSYRLIVEFDIDDNIIEEPAEAWQRIYGVRIKYHE